MPRLRIAPAKFRGIEVRARQNGDIVHRLHTQKRAGQDQTWYGRKGILLLLLGNFVVCAQTRKRTLQLLQHVKFLRHRTADERRQIKRPRRPLVNLLKAHQGRRSGNNLLGQSFHAGMRIGRPNLNNGLPDRNQELLWIGRCLYFQEVSPFVSVVCHHSQIAVPRSKRLRLPQRRCRQICCQ